MVESTVIRCMYDRRRLAAYYNLTMQIFFDVERVSNGPQVGIKSEIEMGMGILDIASEKISKGSKLERLQISMLWITQGRTPKRGALIVAGNLRGGSL